MSLKRLVTKGILGGGLSNASKGILGKAYGLPVPYTYNGSITARFNLTAQTSGPRLIVEVESTGAGFRRKRRRRLIPVSLYIPITGTKVRKLINRYRVMGKRTSTTTTVFATRGTPKVPLQGLIKVSGKKMQSVETERVILGSKQNKVETEIKFHGSKLNVVSGNYLFKGYKYETKELISAISGGKLNKIETINLINGSKKNHVIDRKSVVGKIDTTPILVALDLM